MPRLLRLRNPVLVLPGSGRLNYQKTKAPHCLLAGQRCVLFGLFSIYLFFYSHWLIFKNEKVFTWKPGFPAASKILEDLARPGIPPEYRCQELSSSCPIWVGHEPCSPDLACFILLRSLPTLPEGHRYLMTFYSRRAALILRVSQIPLSPHTPEQSSGATLNLSCLSSVRQPFLMLDVTDRILTFASITFYIPCLPCCLILLTLISSEQ